MAGELTIDEKLAMTLQALKTLRAQLFEAELHRIANVLQFVENTAAAKQHTERERSLKVAITQLENKHQQLLVEKTSEVRSNPANQIDHHQPSEQSSDPAQSDLPQPRSRSPQSEAP